MGLKHSHKYLLNGLVCEVSRPERIAFIDFHTVICSSSYQDFSFGPSTVLMTLHRLCAHQHGVMVSSWQRNTGAVPNQRSVLHGWKAIEAEPFSDILSIAFQACYSKLHVAVDHQWVWNVGRSTISIKLLWLTSMVKLYIIQRCQFHSIFFTYATCGLK